MELHRNQARHVPPEVVVAAHAQLARIHGERAKHDWYGEFGKPLARESQMPPRGAWSVWIFMAGRGAGKTRAASEYIRQCIKDGYTRVGLIAATAADARDVMVEGDSGILAVCHESDRARNGRVTGIPLYEPSKRRLTWANGAIASIYSAEKQDRLRGPQHQVLWCDELAAWERLEETWDMAMFGLRLNPNPHVVVSTTPQPRPLIRELIKQKTTVVTTGSTHDNKPNLSAIFYDNIISKYEGTRLGRQEIYAELLEEAEGALWSSDVIDRNRIHHDNMPDLARVCVSVDPAVTSGEEASETGIIVCGAQNETSGFVLEDGSGRYTSLEWATVAVNLFHKHKADYIIAEVNNGGDLVRDNIHNVWPKAPVKMVHARRGKYLRAEPVAALYEQDKVKHMGEFKELEMQMKTWEPLGKFPSPDRLDALVHGLTSLMIRGQAKATRFVGPFGSRRTPLISPRGI